MSLYKIFIIFVVTKLKKESIMSSDPILVKSIEKATHNVLRIVTEKPP
jgi:hypothetical protein